MAVASFVETDPLTPVLIRFHPESLPSSPSHLFAAAVDDGEDEEEEVDQSPCPLYLSQSQSLSNSTSFLPAESVQNTFRKLISREGTFQKKRECSCSCLGFVAS